MQPFVLLVKALADETRLKILLALQHGELCVCQLTTFLELAPSTVSKHISLLLQAGLVSKRKCGTWAFYGLAKRSVSPAVAAAHEFVAKSLDKNPEARKEITRLKKLLRVPLEEVCRIYQSKKKGKIA